MITDEQIRTAWKKYWALVAAGKMQEALEAFNQAKQLENVKLCRSSTRKILAAKGLI